MTMRHYLLGFDKATGAPSQEWPIPRRCEAEVARIIRAGAERLAAVDPRKLTPRQVERVGTAIGQQIEAKTRDYFVQTFDEPRVGDRSLDRHRGGDGSSTILPERPGRSPSETVRGRSGDDVGKCGGAVGLTLRRPCRIRGRPDTWRTGRGRTPRPMA